MHLPERLKNLPLLVADMLQDDIESVSSLIKMLNDRDVGWRHYWGTDFTPDDVIRGLRELINQDWAQVLVYDPVQRELVPGELSGTDDLASEEIWYRLTKTGQRGLA